MAEPIETITMHVPRSPDGETEFARVADILDHLATLEAWEPNVHAWLVAKVNELRQIDQVYANELEKHTE